MADHETEAKEALSNAKGAEYTFEGAHQTLANIQQNLTAIKASEHKVKEVVQRIHDAANANADAIPVELQADAKAVVEGYRDLIRMTLTEVDSLSVAIENGTTEITWAKDQVKKLLEA